MLEFADAHIRLDRHFLPPAIATRLMQALLTDVAWQQDTITLFGKTHLLPRLHQWFGEAGTSYRWSGIQMHPKPWFPALAELHRQAEIHTNTLFNCVLINLYRDGNDCMGWHADDEAVLGEKPVIASISLGAERDLLLRRQHARNASQRITLNHGSLLLMAGDTQSNWQHALPRRKHVTSPRINLTFRYIELASSSGINHRSSEL
jgi:alkylated DNA repair dioxygenase AlkB